MTKKEIKQAKKGLKDWLHKWTKCQIQGGWPCGTCTRSLLIQLGIYEDKEHNKPIDRINEVWRSILQIRKDK